ncbi:MAG: hypothetical protein ACLQU4_08170 [Limisphaerales bacterium]
MILDVVAVNIMTFHNHSGTFQRRHVSLDILKLPKGHFRPGKRRDFAVQKLDKRL